MVGLGGAQSLVERGPKGGRIQHHSLDQALLEFGGWPGSDLLKGGTRPRFAECIKEFLSGLYKARTSGVQTL